MYKIHQSGIIQHMTLAQLILMAAITSFLTIVGNIVYFRYRLNIEQRKNNSHKKLTLLLAPLYIALQTFEIREQTADCMEDWDQGENIVTKPKRILGILSSILEQNLYLADETLHRQSILFLEWAIYNCADEKRHYDLYHGKGINDEIYEEFKKTVYTSYQNERNKYLDT